MKPDLHHFVTHNVPIQHVREHDTIHQDGVRYKVWAVQESPFSGVVTLHLERHPTGTLARPTGTYVAIEAMT